VTAPLLRYVDAADGTRIAWQTHLAGANEEAVGTRPLVVLTNGLSTTENFWDGLIAPLASAYRVVHWSYRGHSKSECARSGDYAIATHADDLARVTEAAIARGTNTATPVHVAFSMGVTVLLEFYRRRPDRVAAMVLIAGGADQPRASSALFRVPLARPALRVALRAAARVAPRATGILRRASSSKAIFPIARAVGALGPDAPREPMEHFFRALGAMDMRAYWASVRSLAEAHASDVLPTVKVPVLVIAPASDVLASRRDLEILRDSIPGVRWLEVPNTSHAILLEAADVVAAAVRELFAAVRSQAPRVQPQEPLGSRQEP
jgi:pimeloyl-ACP methyl ester carboxylesterase